MNVMIVIFRMEMFICFRQEYNVLYLSLSTRSSDLVPMQLGCRHASSPKQEIKKSSYAQVLGINVHIYLCVLLFC